MAAEAIFFIYFYSNMGLKLLFSMVLLVSYMQCFAQARTQPPRTTPYFKLLESYTQRKVPGMRGANPVTNTYFLLVWESAIAPDSFCWKDQAGVLRSCILEKAHKVTGQSKQIPQGINYLTEKVNGSTVHRNDTLLVTTIAGNASAPVEILNTRTNTLLFKTRRSKWMPFPVLHIDRKEDIRMP